MNFMHVFSCEAANGYLVGGLLISAAVTALMLRRLGVTSYIGRLYFVIGTAVGVLAGAVTFWLLHDRCI